MKALMKPHHKLKLYNKTTLSNVHVYIALKVKRLYDFGAKTPEVTVTMQQDVIHQQGELLAHRVKL